MGSMREDNKGFYIEEFRDFNDLFPEWDDLVQSCASPTPFLTRQWLSTWWRHFSTERELLLLRVKDRKNKLLGIAPLYVEAGRIKLIGEPDLCDYQDFVISKGKEEEFIKTLLNYLWKLHRPPLYIDSLPAFSPTLQVLGEENGCKISLQDTTPIIHLPSSLEEYLASLSQKHRHEIRRKIRKIETDGEVAFYGTESHQKLGDFLKLHKSSQEKAKFMNPRRERFFYDMANLFSKEGWLKLFFLTLNQKEIASLLCFQFQKTLYLYNSGYDLEYSPLSPGIVILAYTIQDAIQKGIKGFNLLRGGEKYKYHIGAQDLKLYKVCVNTK